MCKTKAQKTLSGTFKCHFLKWHYYLKVLGSDKDYVYDSA